MVAIPGAMTYLKYQGNPNPSAGDVYQQLEKVGLLDIPLSYRTPDSILKTINNRLSEQYCGLKIRI